MKLITRLLFVVVLLASHISAASQAVYETADGETETAEDPDSTLGKYLPLDDRGNTVFFELGSAMADLTNALPVTESGTFSGDKATFESTVNGAGSGYGFRFGLQLQNAWVYSMGLNYLDGMNYTLTGRATDILDDGNGRDFYPGEKILDETFDSSYLSLDFSVGLSLKLKDKLVGNINVMYASISQDVFYAESVYDDFLSYTLSGSAWQLGAGLGYRLTDNWQVNATYLFSDVSMDTIEGYDVGEFNAYQVHMFALTLSGSFSDEPL